MSAGRVVVVGAGTAGLATATLLARRGLAVTVLDPAPPTRRSTSTPDGGAALPGSLVARSRAVLAAELPDVLAGCIEGDGGRAGILADPSLRPAGLVGYRPESGDAALVTITTPGAVLTRRLRLAAAAEEGLELRPGVTATGLCTDPLPGGGRVVRAVVTDAGPAPATVVVDASGAAVPWRRHWSDPAGARPARRDPGPDAGRPEAPCGATLLIRSYRRHDGGGGPAPAVTVTLDGCDLAVIPGSGGVGWIAFAVPDDDPLADVLAQPAGFDAAAALVDAAVPWVDPEAGDALGGVTRLSGATNGLGGPGPDPLGLHRVGAAGCRTDPSHGLDLGLTLLGAQHLARVLQCYSDPVTRAEATRAFTATELAPWVEASVARDHARLRRWRPERLPPEPRWWPTTSDADARLAAERDPVAWRLVARMDNLLSRPDEVLERPDLADAVARVRRSGAAPAPVGGPERGALLAAARGSTVLAR